MMKIIGILKDFLLGVGEMGLNWPELKSLGGSRMVRISFLWLILVPLAAKALSKAGPEIQVGLGEHLLTIPLALPFSWKLFYFGAAAFAAGTFVYRVGCPRLIRDYVGYNEYQNEGRGPEYILNQCLTVLTWRHGPWKSNEIHVLDEFIDRYTQGDVWHKGIVRMSFASPPDNPARTKETKRGRMHIPAELCADAFWFARNASADSHPWLRTICTALLVTGYTFFLWVAGQGFLFVLRFV
jgi:hypothetical protein